MGRHYYESILTGWKTYGCCHCGEYQRYSRWNRVALWNCVRHENKCPTGITREKLLSGVDYIIPSGGGSLHKKLKLVYDRKTRQVEIEE